MRTFITLLTLIVSIALIWGGIVLVDGNWGHIADSTNAIIGVTLITLGAITGFLPALSIAIGVIIIGIILAAIVLLLGGLLISIPFIIIGGLIWWAVVAYDD